MDWTAQRHDDAQFARGYQEQTAWLQGKTLDEARQALDARMATAAYDPYNLGGDTATWDYIGKLSKAAS